MKKTTRKPRKAAAPKSAERLNDIASETPTAPVVDRLAQVRKDLLQIEETQAKAAVIPHLIVEARAGAGKTTTLVEGLKRVKGIPSTLIPSPQQAAVWEAMELSKDSRTVCFVAFNKSIATELQKRVPQGCDAMTMHSMGFKAVQRAFGRVKVDSFRVQNIIEEITGRDIRELRKYKMVMVKATEELVGLCKMNLIGWSVTDAASVDWDEMLTKLASHYGVEMNGSQAEVFQLVPKVLERCKEVTRDNAIDFDDMVWLPVALNLPLFQYDLLLVDEAQDLNRCQQALAKRAGSRLILCGDPCQPPGTMVTLAGVPGNRWHPAIDGKQVPIQDLKVGDILVGYSPKDGRNYSNRTVEGISETHFTGEMVVVTTEDGVVTQYTPEHYCYASFGSLRDYHGVYLMKRGSQFRIGSCQINYQASGNGLVHRLRTEGGDSSWLLEVHPTKREARLREMELSHQFNLPQIVFSNANDGYILDDEGVDRFWDFVGNNAKLGQAVLNQYKLEWGRPIAVPGEQWQQSFKRPSLFSACNLFDGMEVRTETGRWVKIAISRVSYDGLVYSLTVSHDQLYMADGIVTHNCQAIYGFAGADAESMPRMAQELGATERGCQTLPLTVTRRCGKAIVLEANKIVPDFAAFETNPEGLISKASYNDTPKPQEGLKPVLNGDEACRIATESEKGIGYRQLAQPGDMILCRVNAPLVSQCFKFLKEGRKAQIQGRDIGQGLIKTIEKMHAATVTELLMKLDDWRITEERKENNRRNPDESRLIAIHDRYECLTCFCEDQTEVAGVVARINSIFTDEKSGEGVRLSSVHKAKGLEAGRVFILQPKGASMPHPMAKSAWQKEQEMNLKYVAITRAIHELVYVS